MSAVLGYGFITSGLIVAIATANSALETQWFYAGTIVMFIGAFVLMAGRHRKERRPVSSDLNSHIRSRKFRDSRSRGGDQDADRDGSDGDAGDGD
jgi:hypothetical protein